MTFYTSRRQVLNDMFSRVRRCRRTATARRADELTELAMANSKLRAKLPSFIGPGLRRRGGFLLESVDKRLTVPKS